MCKRLKHTTKLTEQFASENGGVEYVQTEIKRTIALNIETEFLLGLVELFW